MIRLLCYLTLSSHFPFSHLFQSPITSASLLVLASQGRIHLKVFALPIFSIFFISNVAIREDFTGYPTYNTTLPHHFLHYEPSFNFFLFSMSLILLFIYVFNVLISPLKYKLYEIRDIILVHDSIPSAWTSSWHKKWVLLIVFEQKRNSNSDLQRLQHENVPLPLHHTHSYFLMLCYIFMFKVLPHLLI